MKLGKTIGFLLVLVMPCMAQRSFQRSEFQLLTMHDGLCNNTVTDIEQDEMGILWLSTDAGISRYDGVTFYSRTLADKEPIALSNLFPTGDNLVWSMAKFRARVCCFNRLKGRFMEVKFTRDDVLPRILNIRVVGTRLLAVTPEALYRLDVTLEDDTVTLDPHLLLNSKVPFVNLYGHDDTVYMSTTQRQMVLHNLTTQKTVYIDQPSLHIQNPAHIRHSYLGNDHLWLCSDREGLICYSLKENKVRRITLTEPENGIREARIFDIAYVSDTVYIVSTRSSLLKMTFSSPQLTHSDYTIEDLTPDREVYGGILNERVNCIYYDRGNRILWVGTMGGGLMKLRLWADDIIQVMMPKEMGRLGHIDEGADGYIWVVSETGLYRSDNPRVEPQMHFTRWHTCRGEGGHTMFRDTEANLWVGNEMGQVRLIRTLTGSDILFTPTYPDGSGIGAVRALCLNARNRLWLATDSALVVYDYKADRLLASRSFQDLGMEVKCLAEECGGGMWLGTDHGLHLCRREDDRLITEGGFEQPIGMNPGLVRALYTNRYGVLFATYTNKIITIDDKSKTVTGSLMVNRELRDGHIQCLVDDRNGNTWMGSNTGVSTYNNRTGQVFHYDSSCNYFDVAYLADGSLLWSTSTGLLHFSPRKIKEQAFKKQLHLSAVEVNNVRLTVGQELNGQVVLDRPSYSMDRLVLEHPNNNLVLTFTSMNYASSQERVYYRLLPGNGEWQVAWDGHVHLNALEAGQYKLEVCPPMPFDGDVDVLTLPIQVKRHPALTVWAFLLYAVILVMSGYGVYFYVQRKMSIRRQRRHEREELEVALDEEKEKNEKAVHNRLVHDNFHLALAQEMRSPLAMAVVPLREMNNSRDLPEALRGKVDMAYHNTVYLQDICNQLLNICQHENQEETLNVAPYAVSDLADEAVRMNRDLLNVSEVNLLYSRSQRIREEIWVDRRQITFVLSNVLSNAYRRVGYTGVVEMKAEITEFEGRDCCLYTIRDMSHDPSPSYSVRLGDNDFTVLQEQLHPEIGAEVMRDIVRAHDGEMLLSHVQDEGTEMNLYIPLGRAHFTRLQPVNFVEPEIFEPDEEKNTQMIEQEERDVYRPVNPQEALEMPMAKAPASRYTLLIIEDNADIRLYLKVLMNSTYNVLLAENGQEGIRTARKEQPDLIITDIMMPVMDGLECCRILKEDLKTCQIPIVMLTALTSDKDVVKGLETGADDYILKPFNPEILRSKIKNLIQNRVELKRIYTRLLMTATPAEEPAPDAPAAEETTGLDDPFIATLIDLIQHNLGNPNFSVKRLAEHVNMSQPTLYRKVKQLTSYTIIELIRGVRLKQAAELLRSKKYSVTEVAEMVGYNDAPTFRKHFIDMYGTTPSTFNS